MALFYRLSLLELLQQQSEGIFRTLFYLKTLVMRLNLSLMDLTHLQLIQKQECLPQIHATSKVIIRCVLTFVMNMVVHGCALGWKSNETVLWVYDCIFSHS